MEALKVMGDVRADCAIASPATSISGAPKPLAYVCLEAPREGQATHVHSKEIVEGLGRLGHQVHFFPAVKSGGHRPTLFYRVLASLLLQLRLVGKVGGYSAVYMRSHPLALPVALSCYLRGIPVVQEVNGTYADIYLAYPSVRFLRPIIDFVMRTQYRWAAGLIAVTPGLVDWLRDELGRATSKKIAFISNGANPDIFHPERQGSVPLPERYVAFVGSLVPWHDIEVILNALQQPCWPADVSLVLVGDCGDAPRVQAALSRHPNLIVAGRVPYEQVGGVLARSSSSGVAPLKLFEAIACGTPIIASHLPYQAELVLETGAGLLFPPGDAAGLARAVAEVHANPQRFAANSRSAAQIIRAEHSWKKRAEQTNAFLQDVLNDF
jgi:glycosyltransferase involved in cell wall biosynthesis